MKRPKPIRHDEAEMGTPENTFFYGYKEPLKSFKGGFGYAGVLTYSKDKDRVQCHLCGKLFRSLNVHISAQHSITVKEYKLKTGLATETALVGEGTREKHIKTHNLEKWRAENPEKVKAIYEKFRKTRGKKKPNRGKSLEWRNQKGTCPDQLLDIIQKTITSFGRVPTVREFNKFHRNRYFGAIVDTYGSYSKALAKIGKKPVQVGTYTQQELVRYMSEFYQKYQRTPSQSDMKRGLLPSTNAYFKHFTSLNHARLMSGCPLVIPIGGFRGHVEEWLPTPEQREKLLQQSPVVIRRPVTSRK